MLPAAPGTWSRHCIQAETDSSAFLARARAKSEAHGRLRECIAPMEARAGSRRLSYPFDRRGPHAAEGRKDAGPYRDHPSMWRLLHSPCATYRDDWTPPSEAGGAFLEYRVMNRDSSLAHDSVRRARSVLRLWPMGHQ